MKFSRRSFLRNGVISAVGLGITASSLKVFGQNAVQQLVPFPDLLASINAENFRTFIGKDFIFYTEDSAYQTILLDVVNQPDNGRLVQSGFRNKKNKSSAECFHLRFSVENQDLPQATYKVYQESLGTFDLFVVSGKSDKAATILTAIFNRI